MRAHQMKIKKVGRAFVASAIAATLLISGYISPFIGIDPIVDTAYGAGNGIMVGVGGSIGTSTYEVAEYGIWNASYDNPVVRVGLFRHPDTKLETEKGLDKIYDKLQTRFVAPTEGGIYFAPPEVFNGLRAGKLVNFGKYNPGTKAIDAVGDPTVAANLISKTSNHTSTVYYNDILGKSADVLLNEWQAKAVNKAASTGLWSYILEISGQKYQVDEKIRQIFNPSSLDMNNIVNWTDAQKQDQFYRYLDMLMTLYTCAEGQSKIEWQNAIDDYLSGNNLDTRPITISLDIMPIVTMPNSQVMLISTIDYHQYCTATESMYDMTSDVWAKSADAGTVAGNTEDQLIKSTQLSINTSPTRARISDSFNNKDGFSFGQSALTDKIMRTSGNNAHWVNYVNISYMNALKFVRPSGGGANKVIGFAVLPAPIPSPSSSWANFEALPDNKVVFSKVISQEVDLHITSAVSTEDRGKWQDIINNAKSQGKQFIVEISTRRSSAQTGGAGTYSPNVSKQTFSPEKMWSFISGSEEILYYDTSTASVEIANKQHIIFNYTVNLKVTVGNQVFSATMSDDASFVRKGERIGYTSTPEAYSELKNYGGGSNMTGTLNEDWEAMAGVPSTEQLYFAAGGSEFIVDITLEHTKNETAVRTYNTFYTTTECEFKAPDIWPGGSVKAPTGSQSSSLDLNHDSSLTVTATWTGSEGSCSYNSSCPFTHSGCVVEKRAKYNQAVKDANAWVAYLTGTEVQSVVKWKAKSDGLERKSSLSASITTNTKGSNGSAGSHGDKTSGKPPVTEPHGSDKEGKACDPSYTVTVTATLPAHVICGPCCSHQLPEVHDTWEQTFNYDSMKIVDVHVWKIDQAAINGMTEVTGKNIVSADIVRGEPNFFYNIALKQDANFKLEDGGPGKSTGTSKAGRVRYSLSPEQHDLVTYANGTRTNKCDGMSTTYPPNVIAAGGKGHGEAYSTGFIYNSHKGGTSTTGTSSPSSTHYPRNEVGHLVNGTDVKDKATVEYSKFYQQRNAQNQTTMISDFLILQTSSGDQSVMYYDQKAASVTAETKVPDMRVTKETLWDYNSNSASNWKQDTINVGGYNGNYRSPNSKFNGSGRSNAKRTMFEPDPAGTISKPAVNRNMMLYQGQINIVLQNTNKSYLVGKGEVFWSNVLHWTDKTGEGFNGVNDPHTTAPYSTNAITTLIGYEAKANHGTSNSGAEGRAGGFKLNAPYSESHRKTNDLIVQDPVSTEFALIESLPNDRDQRIKDTLIGGADNTQDALNKTQTCPRQPGLCEFRVLNCNYLRNQVLANFDFDTLSGSQVVNKVTGSRYTLPSGFTVSNAGDGFSSKYLRAYGTRWQIPFADLGLDYATGVNLRVEADIKMPQPGSSGASSMIFSFFDYDFYIPAGQSYGTINTGNGWEKQAQTPVADNVMKHLTVDFNFFDSNLSRVYINGAEVGYQYINPPREVNSSLVGSHLYVGSWGIDSNYPAAFSIDNLKVTRLAGTQNHTAACYRTVYMHPDGLNAHQHTKACLTGGWNCGNSPLNSNYQHGNSYPNNFYGNPTCGLTGTELVTEYELSYYTNCCHGRCYIWSRSNAGQQCGHTHGGFAQPTGNTRQVAEGHVHSGVTGWSPSGCYAAPTQHMHVGSPGLNYANGCFTNPTTHVHNEYCKLSGSAGIVQDIINGKLSDAQLREIFGSAYEAIMNESQKSLYTWSNWTTGNMNGFSQSQTGSIAASGGNLIQNQTGQSGIEATVPVDIEAGALSSVRVTITNNTATATMGLMSNGNRLNDIFMSVAPYATSTVTFNVRGWNHHITSLEFDFLSGGVNGSYSISKIELLGGGSVTPPSSGSGAVVFESWDPAGYGRNLPAGNYRLEVWGAQGGDNGTTGAGGLGGYASGIFSTQGCTVDVDIGGKGSGSLSQTWWTNQGTGGYNGGGAPGRDTDGNDNRKNEMGGGGGGYTTIRTNGTALITAGGGGGSTYTNNPGDRATGGAGGGSFSSPGQAGLLADSGGVAIGGVKGRDAMLYEATGWVNTSLVTPGSIISGTREGNGGAKITSLFTPLKISNGGAGAGVIALNFGYTGGAQSFTAPKTGSYTLEAWGGSGGEGNGGSNPLGQGGYTRGSVQLTAGQTIYIQVGAAGNGQTVETSYNGGGSAFSTSGHNGGQGGGATDFRLLSGPWKNTSCLRSRILVAGGGGGAQADCGGVGTTAGNGGGINGGRSDNGGSYPGSYATGGTQISGGTGYSPQSPGTNITGTFGVGGNSLTCAAGGGGGYFGGGSSYTAGGGGGSSFVTGYAGCDTTHRGFQGGLTFSGVVMQQGGNTGNGRAKISYSVPTVTVEIIEKYWEQFPDKLPNGAANPIWACRLLPLNIHVHNGNCHTVKQLNCTEPHHSGLHYDGSNEVCWDACGSDLNHKSYKPTISTSDGSFKAGNFVNMDYGFRVYFPNEGDFDQGEPYGIGSLTSQRGLGYTDNLDTTKWTRVKRVKFGFNCIYNNKLYLANEWITLGDRGSYTGAPGSKYNANSWTNYNSDRALYNGIAQEWFDFYCVLANYEAKATTFEFEVEAVNSPSGNDNHDKMTNRDRTKSFTALHGGYKMGYIDVVGRIGNLIIEDTGDFRYSNLFKTAIDGASKSSVPPNKFTAFRNGMTALPGTEKSSVDTAWFTSKAAGGGVRGARQDLQAGIYEFAIEGEGLQNGKLKITTGDGANDITSKAKQVGIATTKMSYKVVLGTEEQDVEIWWTANNNMDMTIKSLSTQFKGTDEEKWLIDGVVGEVDPSNQNFYLTWGKDIRGLAISASTKYINTYGTRTWMDGNRKMMPLSPEKNSIEILQEDPLLVGYDMYTDISTIGNYYFNNSSQLQVVPYYYAMDISRPSNPVITPVDVYLLHNGTYEPINIYDKVQPNWDKDSVYDWVVNLDWTEENVRRNYTLSEKQRTEFLADALKESVYDSSGNLLSYKQLDNPVGGFYTLGNAQMMVSNGKSRTFIGGEATYGQLKNLGGGDRAELDKFGVLTNKKGRIAPDIWWRAAQRWHMKLGLPSSAVFVRHGATPTVDTVKEFDNGKFVILSTADIRVIGDTYILGYNQNGNNGSVNFKNTDGNWAGPFTLPPNIPTVFAVYSTTRKSVLDIDIVGIY